MPDTSKHQEINFTMDIGFLAEDTAYCNLYFAH